jgi:hypothetical protein
MSVARCQLLLVVLTQITSGCGFGLIIAGRVVDGDGAPRNGVEVRTGDAIEWTDSDGLFEIRRSCDGIVDHVGVDIYGDDPGLGEQAEVIFVGVGSDVPCGVVSAGTFAFWHADVEPTADSAGLQWQPAIDVPGHELHYIVGNESFEVTVDARAATSTAIDRRIFQDFEFFAPDVFAVRAESLRVDLTSQVEHMTFDRALTELDVAPLVPVSRDASCMGPEDTELYPCPATDGDYVSRTSVNGLLVDLGELTPVSAVAFVNPSLYDQDERVAISVQTSVDGVTFMDVGSVEIDDRRGSTPSVVFELPAPVDARFVRTQGANSTTIGEIGIY